LIFTQNINKQRIRTTMEGPMHNLCLPTLMPIKYTMHLIVGIVHWSQFLLIYN